MPLVARVGVDNAGGGLIINPNQTSVYYAGSLIAVVGDGIAPHGRSPHNSAVITDGSPTVTINGIKIARAGDPTSCGHPVSVASGTVYSN